MTIVKEQNFSSLSEEFGDYFFERIRNKWKFLMHDDPDHVICLDLVNEFYRSFTAEDINPTARTITLHWRGQDITIGIREIAAVTKIKLRNGNQGTQNILFYQSLMGTQCGFASDGGLSGHSLYKNVHATCKLLCYNVVPTAHTSSFYETTLHMVHMLMTKDKYFCVVRQLFDTICTVKTGRTSAPKLPCLITMICRSIMNEDIFAAYIRKCKPLERAKRTSTYTTCENLNWIPAMMEESVRGGAGPSAFEEADLFFRQTAPIEPRDFMHRMWDGMRRIWREIRSTNSRIDRMAAQFSCVASAVTAVADRGSSEPRRRSTGERNVRGRSASGRAARVTRSRSAAMRAEGERASAEPVDPVDIGDTEPESSSVAAGPDPGHRRDQGLMILYQEPAAAVPPVEEAIPEYTYPDYAQTGYPQTGYQPYEDPYGIFGVSSRFDDPATGISFHGYDDPGAGSSQVGHDDPGASTSQPPPRRSGRTRSGRTRRGD